MGWLRCMASATRERGAPLTANTPRLVATIPPRTRDPGPDLLSLPPLLTIRILKVLVREDPLTLLGVVPGVCRELRALCRELHGEFDLCGRWAAWLSTPRRTAPVCRLEGAVGALAWLFPRATGLHTFGEHLLYTACERGWSTVVARLLGERGVDRCRPPPHRRRTPLFNACEQGHVDVVRLLLEHEVDAAAAVGGGWTPLYVACQWGRLEVARLLLDAGASVDRATDTGVSPLGIACQWGHASVVTLLLQRGADVHRARAGWHSPHTKIVPMLRAAGARL